MRTCLRVELGGHPILRSSCQSSCPLPTGFLTLHNLMMVSNWCWCREEENMTEKGSVTLHIVSWESEWPIEAANQTAKIWSSWVVETLMSSTLLDHVIHHVWVRKFCHKDQHAYATTELEFKVYFDLVVAWESNILQRVQHGMSMPNSKHIFLMYWVWEQWDTFPVS